MITQISLVTLCHHTKFSNVIDYISYVVHYTPTTYLFYNWKFVPLNLPYLFHSSSNPPQSIFSNKSRKEVITFFKKIAFIMVKN